MTKKERLKKLRTNWEEFREFDYDDLLDLLGGMLEEKQVEEEKKENIVFRWRAEKGRRYYYLFNEGDVFEVAEIFDENDNFRYNTGNYFLTKKECEDYRKRLLIEQQIKDIALQLNNGEEIDWGNEHQEKYFIWFDYDGNKFRLDYGSTGKCMDIYCLSDEFFETVLNELGEEDLKFYYGVE